MKKLETFAARIRLQLLVQGIAVLSVFVTVGSQGQAQDADTLREQEVLALLRELEATESSRCYPRSSFELARWGQGVGEALVPRIPITCGNSHGGVADLARARRFALRAFEVYGLEPTENCIVEVGSGFTALDGYDPVARIGFELSGRVPPKNFTFAPPDPESSIDELSADELAILREGGARIHVADGVDYPIMDGDEFTSLLAHFASVVGFLNQTTDGPDVDLSAVLLTRGQLFALPSAEAIVLTAGDCTIHTEWSGVRIEVEHVAVLELAFSRPGDPVPLRRPGYLERPVPLDHVLPTAGLPTVVRLDHRLPWPVPETPAPVHLRLTQTGTWVEAASTTLFTPSSFDAARPFVLELVLPAGVHHLDKHLLVGAPES